MGWEDRPYYRDRPATGWNFWTWIRAGSVPVFTFSGIRVRMHAWMVIYIAGTLLFAETPWGIGWKNAATSMAILFGSVLLHEFGHCYGCRWVGGRAENILMWPLGGLAMVEPPHRPWPDLITTACGPAVNLILCAISYGLATWGAEGESASFPWFPFGRHAQILIPNSTEVIFYLWWIFAINYALLVFNLLLIFYPFDGGRIVQALLWMKVGYYKSMRFATVFGMVGAALVTVFGLINGSLMLMLIGVFGGYTCWQQRQYLAESGAEYGDETDYSAAYERPHPSRKTKTSRQLRAAKRARKIAAEHQQEQAILDAILAKVSAKGMASLTWSERRTLKKATEDRRRQDVEV
jgi:Zn-dependent protease